MTKVNDYYQKKQLVERLAAELAQLEKDQALKRELEFGEKIRELMTFYEKSSKEVLEILSAIDPSISVLRVKVSETSQPRRLLKTYKNPHTGEVVKTRGGNHKTLNEWRKKYGKETVQSWQ